MTALLRLAFALMLMCRASAWSSSFQLEQTPATSPDQKTQEQSQPSADPSAQPAPPATKNSVVPTTTTGERDVPPPKPPVLKHRKHKTHRSSSARTPLPETNGDHSKVVVRNGGAKEGSAQLSPAVNPVQAQNQRANTASLLAATDANLKRLAGRQLTPAQKSMVDEINTYMQQARAAQASADTSRAQTLAYKAHLLSDELTRR